VGYHVYLRHGTSVCWHLKTQLDSGPVTADLTTTIIQPAASLVSVDHLRPRVGLVGPVSV